MYFYLISDKPPDLTRTPAVGETMIYGGVTWAPGSVTGVLPRIEAQLSVYKQVTLLADDPLGACEMDATTLAVSGKTTKFTLQARASVSDAALTGTIHLYDTVGALIDTLTWTGAGDVAPTTKNSAVAIALPAGTTYYLASAHVSANPGAFTVYYARLIPQWV